MKISMFIRKRAWPVLFAGIFIGLLGAAFHPFEPHYEGKRLSLWAADLLGPEPFWNEYPPEADRLKSGQAVIAIRHFGIRAMPLALKWCGTEDSVLVEKLKDRADEQKLLSIHFPSDYDRQMSGLKIFEVLGSAAKPAIPQLIRLFQSRRDYTRYTAAAALSYIGPDAIMPLINELTNANPRARETAASTLDAFRVQARTAEPRLLSCLNDDDYGVRNYTAQTLSLIGAPATNIVPALVIALTKHPEYNELGILSALGRFGTNAMPAVPLLVRIIESDQRPTWFFASTYVLTALEKIDPEAAQPFREKLRATLISKPSVQTNPVVPITPESEQDCQNRIRAQTNMMPMTINTNVPMELPH